MLSSVKCVNILLMSVLVCVCQWQKMKKSLSAKILLLIALLTLVSCKKVHQQLPQHNNDRMLQVELKMTEPWKKIVIGPNHPIEYPQIPQQFSMFMSREYTGALKPYLPIKESIDREYSILRITVTHAYKGQTVTPFGMEKSSRESTLPESIRVHDLKNWEGTSCFW